jgi:hypothetical protein
MKEGFAGDLGMELEAMIEVDLRVVGVLPNFGA